MKKQIQGWLFTFPALLHLVIFAIGPIIYAACLSFTHWNILKGDPTFVGFANYREIWTGGEFLNALINSSIYTVASVPIGMAVALIVAILVANQMKGIAFFRTLYYLPAICSQVATAMIWIYVFLPKTGMINATLSLFGLSGETDFLSTPGWAMAALIFMSIWVGLGPRMILFVSGILNIPQSYFEAAEIDGATKNQQFWKITLPLLAPTTFFVGITAMIGSMQVFTPVYMMTKGGPEATTDVVGYHIYSAAWERFQIGEASAMSFILFALIFLLSLVPYRAMVKQNQGVFS